MENVPKHSQSKLYPDELVTLDVLHALKGVGQRTFYRWLTNNYRHVFAGLSERTRLFRPAKTHRDWTDRFLAEPTLLGMAATN